MLHYHFESGKLSKFGQYLDDLINVRDKLIKANAIVAAKLLHQRKKGGTDSQ